MKNQRSGGHKQAQLCAQVAEIASLALGASEDPRLQQLIVHSATASSDGNKLVVHVVPTEALTFEDLEQLVATLDHARSWLRQQVATEIYRKRVPDVAFQIVLGAEQWG